MPTGRFHAFRRGYVVGGGATNWSPGDRQSREAPQRRRHVHQVRRDRRQDPLEAAPPATSALLAGSTLIRGLPRSVDLDC